MSLSQDFFQTPPDFGNPWVEDRFFTRMLRYLMRRDLNPEWRQHLHQIGEDARGCLWDWSQQAEREKPIHIPYDPWGHRVDEIRVSEAWKRLDRYAAEHGLIHAGYNRKEGPQARLLQMSMLYLFHPSSAFFSCPLAMTDGAARALEIYGDLPEHKEAFQHLTSNDPAKFWTSGQWMTEKAGGSDVGLSQTVAKPLGGPNYALTGVKWFTSATTAQMSMALARIEGKEAGSRGLSLFFVRLHDEKGRLRNITIHRLKDKLGTQALPTAELSLIGTPASLVGGEGQGVKKIATLFNITRIYNAVCSVAAMQRALALALSYSGQRVAFGKPLKNQPLHALLLSELSVEKAASTILTFRTADLWGKDEVGQASEEESALLRLMITLSKLYTGKKVVQFVSEVIESFGGAGYIEDTGLPKHIRDAQVFPIWEGATNVLSLDVLRALNKECSFEILAKDVNDRLSRVSGQEFQNEKKALQDQMMNLSRWLSAHGSNQELLVVNARGLAFEMSEILIKSLLIEMASVTKDATDIATASRFSQRPAWRPVTSEVVLQLPRFNELAP